MKALTAKEVEVYLKEAGYVFSRTEGSHFIWKNVTTDHAIPIPHHGNKPSIRVRRRRQWPNRSLCVPVLASRTSVSLVS